MLRVLGVTLDNTTNYGSCFQALALSEAMKGLTVGGEPVDYGLISVKPLRPLPPGLYKHLLGEIVFKVNRAGFAAFERRHIRAVDVPSVAALKGLNDAADAFVCGSDVIWNPTLNKGMGAYYLDFARKYKFSYAASFGTADLSDGALAPYAESFASFREIGLREASGERFIRPYTNAPATVVADPVLLLDGAQWDALATPGGKKGGHIFVYTTHYNAALMALAADLEKRTGLKTLYSAWNMSPREMIRQKKLIARPPAQFLRQLRDADYVVTNSFHATAFAVLFHKRFFTVVHGEKGGGTNTRMAELLSAFGLEDRLLNAVPAESDLSDPDFTTADARLAALRAESLAFIRRNLEAAYAEKMKNQNT